MPELAIPDEGTYGEIERDLIDNEPPGLFPGDQNSYWGQVRKVFADYLQVLADKTEQWYANLDPSTVDENDIHNWENMLGVPTNPGTGATLQQRRTFIQFRLGKGPFTRTRRQLIVEMFIAATFGEALSLTSNGLSLTAGGLSFSSGSTDFTGTYVIVEDIPNFSYQVRILDTIAPDMLGLTRELERITPAGIDFEVVLVPVL